MSATQPRSVVQFKSRVVYDSQTSRTLKLAGFAEREDQRKMIGGTFSMWSTAILGPMTLCQRAGGQYTLAASRLLLAVKPGPRAILRNASAAQPV